MAEVIVVQQDACAASPPVLRHNWLRQTVVCSPEEPPSSNRETKGQGAAHQVLWADGNTIGRASTLRAADSEILVENKETVRALALSQENQLVAVAFPRRVVCFRVLGDGAQILHKQEFELIRDAPGIISLEWQNSLLLAVFENKGAFVVDCSNLSSSLDTKIAPRRRSPPITCASWGRETHQFVLGAQDGWFGVFDVSDSQIALKHEASVSTLPLSAVLASPSGFLVTCSKPYAKAVQESLSKAIASRTATHSFGIQDALFNVGKPTPECLILQPAENTFVPPKAETEVLNSLFNIGAGLGADSEDEEQAAPGSKLAENKLMMVRSDLSSHDLGLDLVEKEGLIRIVALSEDNTLLAVYLSPEHNSDAKHTVKVFRLPEKESSSQTPRKPALVARLEQPPRVVLRGLRFLSTGNLLALGETKAPKADTSGEASLGEQSFMFFPQRTSELWLSTLYVPCSSATEVSMPCQKKDEPETTPGLLSSILETLGAMEQRLESRLSGIESAVHRLENQVQALENRR